MTLRFNLEDLRLFSRIPQGRISYYSTDTLRTYAPDDSNPTLNTIAKTLNNSLFAGEASGNQGVRQLPLDPASGKLPVEVALHHFPPDEWYSGPLSWSQFRERESWWEQIYLQTNRKTADPALCRVCQRRKIVKSGKFTDEIKISYRSFGTWAQLLCREKCMICRLIVRSLCSGEVVLRLHPYLAKVDHELQGTQLVPVTLASGEICMAVEYSLRRIGVMRIVTQVNFREVLRQSWQFDGVDVREFLKSKDSPFNDQADQTVLIDQLKAWIQLCEREHGDTCDSLKLTSEDGVAFPILLIDVNKRCLVRSTMTPRFLALSYVWGKVSTPETLRSNLKARLQPQGLPPALPKTIEDAILLSSQMQEQYLWVDALCIVQDDAEAKHSSIQSMDRIYSAALATIICLHGKDANAGLPGVRPGSRKPQNIETRYSLDDGDQTADDLRNTASSEEFLTDGVLAMVSHPPPLKYALEASAWHHRGWTFQERLLSKRGIYFSSDYVYFQCGQHTQCETGGNIVTWSDITTSPESGNATELIRSQQTNPLLHFKLPLPTKAVEFPPRADKDVFDDYGILTKTAFDVYKDVVEMYTKKQLSFSTDILNALAGIQAVIRNRVGGEFIAGCSTGYLDLSLLWTSTEPADRRTEVGAGGSMFPSWSWAGWTGAKQYLIMEDGKRTYRSLHHEYARSEIRRFEVYFQGTLLDIRKPAEETRATEVRNLGSLERPLEETFPKYVPYADGFLRGILGPNLGPNVLQFWAEAVDAKHFSISEVTGPFLTDHEHANITTKQTVSKLLDSKNQYCGLIFKPTAKSRQRKQRVGLLQFILISSFGESKDRRTGFQTTDTKLRPFDEEKFPWMGEGSGIVNLMLIKWYDEIAERISVARVHRKAWAEAGPVMRHIRLA
ncbi:heterokaryon incompatibility protein-domain-containing protein, partial [Leptodontidium sp. MPI-SDFR-AT-0119]